MRSQQVTAFNAPLADVETPTPEPKGTEVLLEVLSAGVCHSDLHIWEGAYDLGNGRKLTLADRGIQLPLIMGHETVGRVVATGESAEGAVKGRTYLVYPWIGCGQCPTCLAGAENLCTKPNCLGVHRHGGYADHIVVPHARYLVDIEGLDSEGLAPEIMAPYACSGLTTYSALKKFGPGISDSPVLIIGAGGLGLMAVEILKALGGKGAVIVDIDAEKRAAALKAGALAAIDGRASDALAQVTAALGGPARHVLDLVGSPQTAALGFDSLGRGAMLVMVGLFGGAAPWPLPLVPIKAATIIGSYVGNLGELRELVALVRGRKVQPINVTCCPLHDANRALTELRTGKLIGRAVLVPERRPNFSAA